MRMREKIILRKKKTYNLTCNYNQFDFIKMLIIMFYLPKLYKKKKKLFSKHNLLSIPFAISIPKHSQPTLSFILLIFIFIIEISNLTRKLNMGK